MSGTIQGLSGKDKAKVARLLQRIVETENRIRRQRVQHQAVLTELHKARGLAAESVDLHKNNASLRAKLGSALELLRLYQHRLQALESLQSPPASQSAAHEGHEKGKPSNEHCSKCPDMSSSPATEGYSDLPAEAEWAPQCRHWACRCSCTADCIAAQSVQHKLRARPNPLYEDSSRQAELRFPSSVGDTGASAHALELRTLAEHLLSAHIQRCPVCMPAKSSEQQADCADPACSDDKKPRKDCGQAAHPVQVGGQASEDTWAFLKRPRQGCATHAARRFDGDLLSLVTDIDDMMSCSERSTSSNPCQDRARTSSQPCSS